MNSVTSVARNLCMVGDPRFVEIGNDVLVGDTVPAFLPESLRFRGLSTDAEPPRVTLIKNLPREL